MKYKRPLVILTIAFLLFCLTEFLIGFPVYFFQYFSTDSVNIKKCSTNDNVCNLKVGDYFYIPVLKKDSKKIPLYNLIMNNNRLLSGNFCDFSPTVVYDADFVEDTKKIAYLNSEFYADKSNFLESYYMDGIIGFTLYRAKNSGESKFIFTRFCLSTGYVEDDKPLYIIIN